MFGVEYVAEMMMRDCIYPSISMIWLTANSEVDMFEELLTVMPWRCCATSMYVLNLNMVELWLWRESGDRCVAIRIWRFESWKRSWGWLCRRDFRGRKYSKWGRVVTPVNLINYLIKYIRRVLELIDKAVNYWHITWEYYF